ncbi:MAG: hypothetical protein AAF581_18950 [Planctomycetota bacterium]
MRITFCFLALLCLSEPLAAQHPNDTCTSPLIVPPGACVEVGFDSTSALTELGYEPVVAPGANLCDAVWLSDPIAQDIWFQFTAESPETTLSTCGSSFDTKLEVYDGCPQTVSNLVACNDNSNDCPGSESKITVMTTPGAIYLIRVGGSTASTPTGASGTLMITPGLSFGQLDWHGITTTTNDSSWCRVRIPYVGYSSPMYFNLNVDGAWVVRNMGLGSPYGVSVPQVVTTTFDLGVPAGTDVASLGYACSITPIPMATIPAGTLLPASVFDLRYQIGGEGGVNLGTPGAPAAPLGGNTATVVASAKLPNIGSFVNQVQTTNECAPGAVSNSLKYLQAAGQPMLPASVATSIGDLRAILGTTDADGTPANWPMVKQAHYQGSLMTMFIPANDIAAVMAAVNAGKDVELDLAGHVAVVAGVRQYSDGRVELDIFDDNQSDSLSDPIRTVEIKAGAVNNMSIDRFVVEMAVTPVERTINVALSSGQISGDTWTLSPNATIPSAAGLAGGAVLCLNICFDKTLALTDTLIDEDETIGFQVFGNATSGLGTPGLDMPWTLDWKTPTATGGSTFVTGFGGTGKFFTTPAGGNHVGGGVPGTGPGVPSVTKDVEFINDGTLRVCGAKLQITVPAAYTGVWTPTMVQFSIEADDDVSVECKPVTCASALSIGPGPTAFDTTQSTIDAPWTCAGGGGPDLWYTFSPSTTNLHTFSLCGSSYDTALMVFEGSTCPPQAGPLACNDDFCSTQSEITAHLTMGLDYTVVVGGFAGAAGTGILDIAIDCGGVGSVTCIYDCMVDTLDVAWTDNVLATGYTVLENGVDVSGLLAPGTTAFSLFSPTPGTNNYEIVAACSLGGSIMGTCSTTIAPTPGVATDLVLALEGLQSGGDFGDIDSAAALATALTSNGRTVALLGVSDFDSYVCLDLSLYETVWVMTGTFPDDYRLTAAEGDLLGNYLLNTSGSIYFESVDHHGFNHVVSLLDEFDGVDSLATDASPTADGDDSFTAMNGQLAPVAGLDLSANLAVDYTQDQAFGSDFTDHLLLADLVTVDPMVTSVEPIWRNHDDSMTSEPDYVTGTIAVHANGSIMVTSSWELGGFGGDQDALVAAYLAAFSPIAANFQRGDCNNDGSKNIADPVRLLNFLFPPAPPVQPLDCDSACDANDDGGLNIADAVAMLNVLFPTGPALVWLAPDLCGTDPSVDGLSCTGYAHCP